jgi:fatty-acyl-CoA synthase
MGVLVFVMSWLGKVLHHTNNNVTIIENAVIFQAMNPSTHIIADTPLAAWLRRHQTSTPDKVALVFGAQALSYRQLCQQVDDVIQQLTKLGLTPGDRLAMLSKNCPAMLIWMAACSQLGVAVVPINFRLTSPEVNFVLQDTQPRVLLAQPALLAALGAPAWPCPLVMIEPDGVGAQVHSERPVQEPSPSDAKRSQALQWDAFLIIYTSGTTGQPKGAVLSRSNFLWANLQYIQAIGVQAGDVTYAVPPLFHIAGLCVLVTPLLYCGGTVVLGDQFDPALTLTAVQSHRVSKMFLVPQMWSQLAADPCAQSADLTSLRVGLVGSAPCPLGVLDYFAQRGVQFQEGFGMSETCGACTLLPSHWVARAPGSVGFAVPHVHTRVMDDGGAECASDEVGELEVAGPNVMQGYWQRGEATAQSLVNGWLRTGDLARRDAQGLLWIVDRNKDMVISGGENVYPAEVEQLLLSHPAVLEVAVIGLPDERFGEVVTGVLVTRTGHLLTLPELRAFCAHALSAYKHPRQLRFVATLPRTATGKVLKRALREQFAGTPDSIYR